MARCTVKQFADVDKMQNKDPKCPATCGPRIGTSDTQVQAVIDSFAGKTAGGSPVPVFAEGGELQLPRGLVPTWTESGGSYRPLDVPPPNYRSCVTTAPPDVRQMTAVIPKTGFMIICDDVELTGNKAIEAPEVPTTVELDARWDQRDGFILRIYRKADAAPGSSQANANTSDQWTGNILRREIGTRKLAYLKHLESQKRVRTRRIEEFLYLKEDVTDDGGSDEGSSETEEFKQENEVGDVSLPEAFLALRIPILQKPAPVVPIHFVLEHLRNRDRSGMQIELVLSNYILAQGEILKERINWEARVGAMFPPGLPIVDACVAQKFKDLTDYDYDMEIELEPRVICNF
ncbi:unnamed protein product [Notodromas monacha]|uniref:Uncharacterized protein n=1 Tax=Notodromas monacha TaxID=399045 RepID=A0A7R9BKG8_9CRUS|nr:unnamed protein product [Notodromas monacha]CAG0915791.1 unnamed protein product [Notodromas monacha]